MLLAWLIIAEVLQIASLLIWFPIFGLSFMSFDAGVTLAAQAFVTAIGIYPLVVLGSSIWAWVDYARKKRPLAGWIMLAPLAYVMLLFLFLQLPLFT